MAHLSVKLRGLGEHGSLVFHLDEVLRIRLGDLIGLRNFLVVDCSVLIVSLLQKVTDLVQLGLVVAHIAGTSTFSILFCLLEFANRNLEVGDTHAHAFTSVSSTFELFIS